MPTWGLVGTPTELGILHPAYSDLRTRFLHGYSFTVCNMMASRYMLRLGSRQTAQRSLSGSLATLRRLQSTSSDNASSGGARGYSTPTVMGIAVLFGVVGWSLSSRKHGAVPPLPSTAKKGVAGATNERFANTSEMEAVSSLWQSYL